jgi:hypothetical protein
VTGHGSIANALALLFSPSLVVLLAACGGSTASFSSTDTCGAAFAAAAGVDKNADTIADRYPAIRACATLDAWSAAFIANNGAGFTGSSMGVLTNVCTAPEVAETPLCKLVK